MEKEHVFRNAEMHVCNSERRFRQKNPEKLEIKIMKKVIYVKRQLRKAYVSGLRRYWRTRKEKTKKYGDSIFSFKIVE